MSALTFEPIEHRYFLDSVEIPSVSAALQEAGFTCAFYRDDGSKEFGTIGHEIARLKILDTLESYDPQFDPWVVGIEKFIEEQKPNHTLLEAMLHKPGAGAYAGTLDYAGMIQRYKDRLCILDWKFWSNYNKLAHASAGLQLSGYEFLLKEFLGIQMNRRIQRAVVHFFKNGYSIYECNDPADINYLRSAVNCWWWRKRH